ncbi:dUTP diphosphatase [Bacillus safensis]|uniref:dUTP diphosphatase n=1 Tax=Bacillus safensis TaxID=561879 RepID=UPI002DBB1BB2|nr:dUTP diphosphatase [Bacillus safensis]MEC0923955.1 dUTP diphosphatase [Bacillus safensis]MEC0996924.1 dUTP diphosphatase [Bacillus safensis]MEC0997282.1 dUTP diphosphatase [Bacillus safensis]
MNLQKMFKMQAELDRRIIREKGLEGRDLLPGLILALQVELAECANEWRGFKFWSENQEPNRTGYIDCDVCVDQPGRYEVIHEGEILSLPCPKCEGREDVYVGDRLLEEYVDCLHFFLSIGNTIGVKEYVPFKLLTLTNDITGFFNSVFRLVGKWDRVFLFFEHEQYHVAMYQFLQLGEVLGFTSEEIEAAYMEKNEINHKRQQEGY